MIYFQKVENVLSALECAEINKFQNILNAFVRRIEF